jgi:hypothetical protein
MSKQKVMRSPVMHCENINHSYPLDYRNNLAPQKKVGEQMSVRMFSSDLPRSM